MRSAISDNLLRVTNTIETLKSSLGINYPIRFIAVSKLQPAEAIREAYDTGHRYFGENYVDELVQKASQLPNDINWHMIGHLQSNKIKKLLSVPNLSAIETVDSIDLATKINSQALKTRPNEKLNVFVQINTSNEATKSGITPENCHEIVNHIIRNCNSLNFKGIMTIGLRGSAEDFVLLNDAKRQLCNTLNLEEREIELSMGMSGDYEEAIRHGSTNVRVGSLIFGERLKH